MGKRKSEVGERTLLMGCRGGKLRKVTFPASWKITFGPLAPGSKGYDGAANGVTLRLYAGTSDQRAAFTDVTWFRDETLRVQERVTKTSRRTVEHDGNGLSKGTVVEATVHEWNDEMAPAPAVNPHLAALTAQNAIIEELEIE